jgi:glycerol-3-phosphate acyltransferase PlsY
MMEAAIRVIAALVAGFLLGSIPFAVIVSKYGYGCDIRDHGSGNAGATNVFRVLGWKAGFIVGVLDVLKGTAAAAIAVGLVYTQVPENIADWVVIGAVFAAMAGHSYSPWVKLRGGKGIATAAGGLLIVTPWAWPILAVTFFLVVYVSRMVSLGSIIVAIEFPILCVLLYGDNMAIVITSFAASAFALWRHRSNIARIYRGEEARIGDRSQSMQETLDELRAKSIADHDARPEEECEDS